MASPLLGERSPRTDRGPARFGRAAGADRHAIGSRASPPFVDTQDRRVSPGFVEKQHCRRPLLLVVEAVAQTPGEAAGSFLSVGSKIAHLVRRERPVHREVIPHVGSGVHFRERAAHFLRRLYATAVCHER